MDLARSLGRNRYAYRTATLSATREAVHDQHFLEQLCQGNSSAWRELIDAWSPVLYNYLIYSTYRESDAQHLLQETFSRFANYVVNDILSPQSRSDLTIMIVSVAYRQSEEYQEQYGTPSFDIELERRHLDPIQHEFFVALNQLTLPIRQLLLLRYLIGLTVHELAAITGHNAANITLILRAVRLHFSQHKE